MKRKMLFLVNPVAGTKKKEGLIKLIETETKNKGIAAEIAFSNSAGEYEWIKEKIAAEGITDIVIVGGDGTVNQTISSLRTLPIQFGIIPVGSGNGLARAAKIPRKPLAALEFLFQHQGKKTDAFLVNGIFSCMLSGIGFDAKVAHRFATKTTRGLLTYTKESILQYFKAHPYQFELQLEDFSFFTDAFFISIANGNQFGNNFTIAPEANLEDGLLDIVIVQKMNKAKLPFEILRQIRGNNKLKKIVEDITKNSILYFTTDSLTIKNSMLAPLHIDGEPIATAKNLISLCYLNVFRLLGLKKHYC